MFLKFMCCKDEELDRAMRIRRKAKKVAVSIPGKLNPSVCNINRLFVSVMAHSIAHSIF